MTNMNPIEEKLQTLKFNVKAEQLEPEVLHYMPNNKV